MYFNIFFKYVCFIKYFSYYVCDYIKLEIKFYNFSEFVKLLKF